MIQQEIISKINTAKSYCEDYKRVLLSIITTRGSYISFLQYADKERYDISKIVLSDNIVIYNDYFGSDFVNLYDKDKRCYSLPFDEIAQINIMRYNK